MSAKQKTQENNTQTKPKMSLKKKLFNAVLVLLACVFALVTFIVITSRMQNKVPFVFGKSTLWVLSDSMEDTIPAHSYVLIKKISSPETEIKEGDIITFYSQAKDIYGQLNTHQVVAIDYENKNFTTKGVNCPEPDKEKVPFENVVGKYERNLPVLTVFGRFYSTRLGLIVTTLVLLVLIVLIFLPDVIKSFKKSNDDTVNADEEKQKEIDRLIKLEVERLKKEHQAEKETNHIEIGQESNIENSSIVENAPNDSNKQDNKN